MTQEEKAKAYDEAIDKIVDVVEAGTIEQGLAEWLFPELAESEDELTWLTRYIEEEAYSLSMDIRDNEDRIKLKKLQKACAWLEKQGEGKSINDTDEDIVEAVKETSILDMVEPKFQNGQWIVWQNKCYKVNCNGCGYELIDQNGLRTSLEYGTVDKSAHLWTIQDAKDGDVLAGSKEEVILMFRGVGNTEWNYVIDYHCYYDYYRKDFIVQKDLEYWGYIKNNHLKPANQEQRDLLFSKMKEEGYEWDAEKKELKKTAIHKWENGDIVRLKKDDGTRWQIGKSNDPDFFDEWFISEIRESGIAGGYVSTYILDTDYEFVNNPIDDAQKEIDKESDKLRKTASETTWSKNDEYLRCWTYDNLRELKDRYGEDYGNVGKCIEWVKSIKERLGGKELKGE